MDRIVQTVRVPLAMARASVIEVEVVEQGPPGDRRLRLALWLIKLAGRLARLRVRVINAEV
jgi:hypothetical protein